MSFAHDTVSALQSTAALISTASAPDSLTTTAGLDEFVTSWEYSGAYTGDEAELATIRGLRTRLRELWVREVDAKAALVNELLAEGHAQPHLVCHDGWGWHIHATRSDQPLVERLSVEAAMGVADVIRAKQTDRMRLCAAGDCTGVLIDLSRNKSRRYCDRGCGNRVHVKAYRERLSNHDAQ